MATTAKRISIALTKEDVFELESMCDRFGENQTEVIKRALILLHYITFNEDKEK
jgi:hypothetical protein